MRCRVRDASTSAPSREGDACPHQRRRHRCRAGRRGAQAGLRALLLDQGLGDRAGAGHREAQRRTERGHDRAREPPQRQGTTVTVRLPIAGLEVGGTCSGSDRRLHGPRDGPCGRAQSIGAGGGATSSATRPGGDAAAASEARHHHLDRSRQQVRVGDHQQRELGVRRDGHESGGQRRAGPCTTAAPAGRCP